MGIYSDVLKELRRDKNLTQKDMGMYFGISATTYCLYENGNRKMSPDMLCDLASILGTSTDYLLGRTDCSEPYLLKKRTGKYADILKLLRKGKNITQKKIGDYFGISAAMYCLYENGKRRMTIDMLCRLAEILDTSTDYILGRTEQAIAYPPSSRKRSAEGEG